jgi:hypothetical protein
MRDRDRRPAPDDAPPGRRTETRVEGRYEPPRILKKRAVAHIAQTFSGAGPSASPGPFLVGNG